MKIEEVELSGFRSFKHPATVKITDQGDLTMMAGTNGAGKSSIWDAIVWCLYGKTARGLKSSAIKCWEALDVASVTVQLRVYNARYDITRTAGPPNTLALWVEATDEAKHVEQSVVTDLIGMSYECFLHSVLLGQFNAYFFDLGPTEKLRLFSQILDLEQWEEASKRAKTEAGTIEKHIIRLEAAEERCRTELDREYDHLVAAMNAESKYTKECKAKIKERKALIRKAVTNIEQHLTIRDEAQKAAEALVTTVAGLYDEEERLRGEQSEAMQNVSNVTAEIDRWRTKVEEEEAELAILTGAGAQCPVCAGTITETKKKVLIKDQRDSIDTFSEKMRATVTESESRSADLEAITRRIDWVRREAKRLKSEAARLEGSARQSDRQADKCRHEQDAAEGEIKTLENSKNPYTEMVAQHEKDVEALKKELRLTREELSGARQAYERYKFWIKGFRDLRLWIVDQALREFEIEVNNSLMQLGLGNWTVAFDVERETKAKTISKGFTALIRSPTSPDEGVPYEVWSGGETQRLRIAGEVGLCNLIRTRTGADINLEVWDEPTKNMNQEGIDDLVEFLRQRAHETEKNLWLVDHHSLDAGQFDRIVRVVKDEDGSRIARI